ncbi:MAG: choice-of-anchor L domain-containing protein [Leptolyngbyaceae cyanobacterium bins.349]|nr:choice-of-anchor L domain-containing protein [Leptolyngbyaceae cyanobacterium bins.349]
MHNSMTRNLLTLVAGILASLPAFPASAFTLTQNSSGQALLNTLLGNTTGLSNFSVRLRGNSGAFGQFQNDPFGLGAGITLSTGDVTQIPGINTGDGLNYDNSDLSSGWPDEDEDGVPGDDVMMDISFDADEFVEKLFFQYVFGSEEFVEWGGSSFNDSFELLLNGQNLARLSDGKLVTVNNLVPNPLEPFHPDYINNPIGSQVPTRLDGFTKVLTFEGLLNKNARNTLSIQIRDLGDYALDSAVFLKAGSLSSRRPDDNSAAVPEPTTMTGLAIAGALGMITRRRQAKA